MAPSTKTIDEFARDLFVLIETELPDTSKIPPHRHERISNELVYLSIFLIDLGMYIAKRDDPNRMVIMDTFWDMVNASGLNMTVLNARVQTYSDAVKAEEDRESSFARLGITFAWNCLSQDDEVIAVAAAEAADRIVGNVVAYAASTTVAR